MTVKGIVLDVYDTILVANKPPMDPYAYIVKELSALGVPLDFHHEKARILTRDMSMEAYLCEGFKRVPHGAYRQYRDISNRAHIHLYEFQLAYQPRPEWTEFVDTAQKHDLKICLGSNLATPFTADVRCKLPQVSQKHFSCETGLAKPSPAFFQTCCEMMGTTPQETVMIGNSRHNDLLAAKQAGFANAFWLPQTDTMVAADDFYLYNGAVNLLEVFHHLRL